jgi:hypothetical protein
MKNLLKILLLLTVFSQFIFCESESWVIKHKEDAKEESLNPTVVTINPIVENPYLEEYSSSLNDGPISRTSGVAPLPVHFFADFVASASGDERIDRFHHYDYTWNFGDTGSGNWGTTGKSKNTAKGAAAVHIFEEPGVYNITLTIRDHSGTVDTENYSVTVTDPDLFYSGNTIYVNNAGDDVFPGAPDAAPKIATNDLSTIVQYATSGNRILLKRGSSWTTSGLTWPSNAGPVTIGAYGTGTDPDALGIYDNNPQITITGGRFLSLEYKQDWRIMDLHLVDTTRTNNCFGGSVNMQRLLLLRLKVEGFRSAITWSHWNDAACMPKDDMVIASCDVSDSYYNVMYVGSERLALLGNIVYESQTQHVVRIWQAYRSVISHNIIHGSSLANGIGSHGLKFHGPGTFPGGEEEGVLGEPLAGTGYMNAKTEFCILADNIFGTSGPWPVAIGPQNTWADERLSNIIIERNRFHPDYGTSSSRHVTVSLQLWGRYFTVRNNIFDGTGSANDYCAIATEDHGVIPAPTKIEIYNNTIYKGDNGSDIHRGIYVGEQVTNSIVQNNLVSFPYASGAVVLIANLSSDLVSSDNLLTDNAQFTYPGNPAPLDRDFTLQTGSPALDQGITVPVYDDYYIDTRPGSSNDLGAFEE